MCRQHQMVLRLIFQGNPKRMFSIELSPLKTAAIRYAAWRDGEPTSFHRPV
jgi:hypothetical protein